MHIQNVLMMQRDVRMMHFVGAFCYVYIIFRVKLFHLWILIEIQSKC